MVPASARLTSVYASLILVVVFSLPAIANADHPTSRGSKPDQRAIFQQWDTQLKSGQADQVSSAVTAVTDYLSGRGRIEIDASNAMSLLIKAKQYQPAEEVAMPVILQEPGNTPLVAVLELRDRK